MNQDFVTARKTELLAERKELQSGLSVVSTPDSGKRVAGENIPNYPDFGHDNIGENSSSPAESAEFAVNVEVTAALQSRLHDVEASLERVEKGTYGTCESCEQSIPEDRLVANPAARTCAACA